MYVLVPNLQVYFQPSGTLTGPTFDVPLDVHSHVSSVPTEPSILAKTHALSSALMVTLTETLKLSEVVSEQVIGTVWPRSL